VKKRIEKAKYIATFSLATLILLIGIIIGQLVAEQKVKEFLTISQELRLSLLGMDTQEKLAKEFLCNVDIWKLTENKIKLGQKIEFLEGKFGKENKDVKELLKEYTLLSIRQWLLLKEFKEKCNKTLVIILFFYSNERNASLSEAQGYILDYIYHKYGKPISIFAFDYELENPALDVLKKIYGITVVPSIVVNEKTYLGFREKAEVEAIINENLIS
jgi:hypothetical protein